MAENNKRFDVVGLLLVLLGIAYAGFAIYWGTNTEWSPHTDYYIQQILNHDGRYVAMFFSQNGLEAIVQINKKYIYAHISPDGLIKNAYILPNQNIVGIARRGNDVYLLSVSGKYAYLFRLGKNSVERFEYKLDLWSLRAISIPQQSDSLVFYVPGTWRDHYGVLRLDFSEINEPEARVFYDIPVADLVREKDNIYFTGIQGNLHELTVRGKVATDYRILVKGQPTSAYGEKVGIKTHNSAGYVEVNGNVANAILLDGANGNAIVTDHGVFVSTGGQLYAITGKDKNSLRVYRSTAPFLAYAYSFSPAEYAILGTYAADPAYIHGTFDFPHCPKNFATIDANVTFITAPVDRIGTIRGVLTPINYMGSKKLKETTTKLSVDFPCYSP